MKIKALSRIKINSNKEITISILPKINSGMNKDEFVKNLEEKIYTELNKLN